MLRYVKEGALDLVARTIRLVSEDDHVADKPRLPQARRCNKDSSPFASRAVAPNFRVAHLHHSFPTEAILLQHSDSNESTTSRPFDAPDPSRPTVDFPYEILLIIFQYLPASDLFSVVAVNRLWRHVALLETKQIDLSECFPMDCLGLEGQTYSDFEFVFKLLSMFPLISSLVIKDRYMRDRDMRVVTAGILAGKMAFTEATEPAIGMEAYREAQSAVAERRRRRQQQQLAEKTDHNGGDTHEGISAGQVSPTASSTTASKPAIRRMQGHIQEELRVFSRSVGPYVLSPRTRNTLRRKILEQLEHNLEHKEVQEHIWMTENGFDPETFCVSTAASLSSPSPSSSSTPSGVDRSRHLLVPMTHYRFQDCCFANDWGADMDVNKLPMIGLAAAISGQGLVVDLEGSYGAPSKSIKTMLGFCFGAHCVISLELNFRHTHMELQHVVELLSENPILYKIDIVDSPAYHELVRIPALRGVGYLMEQMQEACLDLDEAGLKASLWKAKVVLLELEKAIEHEEMMEQETKAGLSNGDSCQGVTASESDAPVPPMFTTTPPRPLNDPSMPIKSLSQQLEFPFGTPMADKIRTAKVLLKGVVHHGLVGLVNTRDRNYGQSLLHTLAWRRSYASLAAQAMRSSFGAPVSLPTPPPQHQHSESTFGPFISSSFPPTAPWSCGTGYPSSLPSALHGSQTETGETGMIGSSMLSGVGHTPAPATATSSGLSSLISISALPAALSSALSLRRLSLPSTLWIPKDSEDVGFGGGSLLTPDPDEDDDYEPDLDDLYEEGNPCGGIDEDLKYKMLPSQDAAETLTSANEPTTSPPSTSSPIREPVVVIPEQHPVAIALRMAKSLLELQADPNVYNPDGRSVVLCASYMGFQPMEVLLTEHGGYLKELVRIRETM
ncbi:hypothetical protein B0O80DRAFT_427631 [Mortierella sp. GBAus27b]|nr:hypothetical protein BGX31_003272 [Mortierella sp. GBA43]KAI8351874.1 hypothetical protein B0O80DRAFT_427631 [Mortierella sp. GBAus27b]